MAAPSKKKSRPRPVTKQELVANNPDIAEAVTNKFAKYKNLALTFTAIAAAIAVLYNIYFWIGGQALITDRVLDKAISNVKTEVNTKIDSTKDEVVKNQNTIKSEITGTLGELTKTMNTVAKSQVMSSLEAAEMQMRLGFTQKQSLMGQLAQVNQALDKNKNDQLASTRKMQLEDLIKQNDTYMQDAQQKLQRIRNGQ